MKFADSPGEGVFRLLGIRVRIFRPIIVLIAFCSAHGIATTAICGELSKRPTILLRAANHANLRSASSDEADVISTVSQGTLLAELPMAVSLPAGRFIFVKPIDRSSKTAGWIAIADTSSSGAPVASVEKSPQRERTLDDMPILIRRMHEEQRNDWRVLNRAINSAAKDGVAVPEAYVARGELWTIAGDTNRAVADFRMATDAAVASDRSLVEQSAYLRLLRDALRRLEIAPKPSDGSNTNDYETAQTHFGAGCHLFWGNRFEESLREFDHAISLISNEPIYWFYRALAHRRLGTFNNATHDALIGCFLEKSKHHDREIGRLLTRVQGADRKWLETYRLGDPSQQLLRLELTAESNTTSGGAP